MSGSQISFLVISTAFPAPSRFCSPNETRYYTDCNCQIAIEASTDTEVIPRRSLHTRDWKVAEAKLRKIAGESKGQTVNGSKLSDCAEKYLDSRKGKMGAKAHGQYKLVLERLKDFATARNKFFAQELTVDVLEDFKTYGLPTIKETTSKGNDAGQPRPFSEGRLPPRLDRRTSR